MTNTERLIHNFKHCQREGVACRFMVGRYTGNGPSVVAALRRRGYSVEPTGKGSYQLTAGPTDSDAGAADTKVRWFEMQNPAFLVGEAGKLIGPEHP